jgi:two-component system response regulator
MLVQKSTVLLVEDNPDDLELTLHALERGRCANRIDVARDGAEACEYLFCEGRYAERDPADEPRLIMLDIKLPLITGIEVLRRIKADPRTHHLPVVMLTSSAEDSDLSASYDLGANSYIVKPVEIDRFFDAINDIGMYWLVLNRSDHAVESSTRGTDPP